MNLKTIILVIISAIIIGSLIVFVPKYLNQNSPTTTQSNTTLQKSSPTPLPTKTPVTINESSNLQDEITKIEIPDFKADFENLKSELQ